MPRRGQRRKKKRTHVEDTTHENDPKSFVFVQGKCPGAVKEMCADLRALLQPNTAKNLRERKSNKIKDFVSVATPLGVTHLLALSSTDDWTHLRLSRLPRGPTITFRIDEYSSARDIQSSLLNSTSAHNLFSQAPLVILNQFGSDKHLKLASVMWQNMFPNINVQRMDLQDCRRTVLLDYDPSTGRINLRHYAIRCSDGNISEEVQRLTDPSKFKDLPSLAKLRDVSEYVKGEVKYEDEEADSDSDADESDSSDDDAGNNAKNSEEEIAEDDKRADGESDSEHSSNEADDDEGEKAESGEEEDGTSDSEGGEQIDQKESDDEKESNDAARAFFEMARGGATVSAEGDDEDIKSESSMSTASSTVRRPLATGVQSNNASNKVKVKLVELGPRLSFHVHKVENGNFEGEVIYHALVKKTEAEVDELKRRAQNREQLRARRRAEQEANVKRKREATEAKEEAERAIQAAKEARRGGPPQRPPKKDDNTDGMSEGGRGDNGNEEPGTKRVRFNPLYRKTSTAGGGADGEGGVFSKPRGRGRGAGRGRGGSGGGTFRGRGGASGRGFRRK